MTEWRELGPPVHVEPANYYRLLGYPAGVAPGERAIELADASIAWYAEHGRPWLYARTAAEVTLDDHGVTLEGCPFGARRLAKLLRGAGARGAVIAAVSAGAELELEAAARWQDDRPDEYFFLETLGSAVVERLIVDLGARLCAWGEPDGTAVLPHDSPGYAGWNVAEMGRLLQLIGQHHAVWPGPIEALDSGALRPKKSGLAVFGLTASARENLQPLPSVPCHNCPAADCQFRRAPYRPTVVACSPTNRP